MIAHVQKLGDLRPPHPSSCLHVTSPENHHPRRFLPGNRRAKFVSAALRGEHGEVSQHLALRRREALLLPSLAAAAALVLHTTAARSEEKPLETPSGPATDAIVEEKTEKDKEKGKEKKGEGEEVIASRIYDATVIGEPQAVGKDKKRVWEKLMAARVIYLGEAEQVPDRDDRVLELEILRSLRSRCAEQQRPIALALEAFPSNLQEQLNQFIDGRIDGGSLRSYTSHWPPERWQEYEPLLNYCRDNGVKLVACGTPLKVLRTVQAEGIKGLSKAERKSYAPPAGSGFISGFTSFSGRSSIDKTFANKSVPFGPSSYLSAQARVVDEFSMSQTITQAMLDGGSSGLLIVVTGASHVIYGSRGIGIPARISRKLQKKNQVVILLDPERQNIRSEGEVPAADFLWYSAAKPCSRNCFDRAEIARVMNAAGQRREALPQDLQRGLDRGVVSPEILQNFFDLEQYPLIAELIHRFQGFRERLLADPKFLHRLAIEESISLTTALVAQYEKRKGRFFEEIDYVLTDTIRGAVVDFFTVWLPAPTLSFLSHADDTSVSENFKFLKELLGSYPDNAFQKNNAGVIWDMNHRFASVLIGGMKLAGVGFISSVGAGVASDVLYAVRGYMKLASDVSGRKRTGVLKSAVIYGSFLGTSANLRYQIIAGLVEHRLSDYLLSYYNEPFLANMLSFVVRTINSYWGTQQWIDIARSTGLQPRKAELVSQQVSDASDVLLLECGTTEVNNVEEESNHKPGDTPS